MLTLLMLTLVIILVTAATIAGVTTTLPKIKYDAQIYLIVGISSLYFFFIYLTLYAAFKLGSTHGL